jgi:hypothetical protein
MSMRIGLNRTTAALVACWVVGTALSAHSASAQGADWPLVYEGRVFDERGRPLEAPVTLTFRLYDAAEGGAVLWSETLPDVTVAAGDFVVLLGQVEPLPGELDAATDLYLALEVDGDSEQRPRTRVGASLRARFADLAERALRVTGGTVDATELRVGGRLVVDDQGQWVGDSAGLRGPAGLACWDTDGDGETDPGEDLNRDGRYNAADCNAGGGGDSLAALDCASGDFVVRTPEGWGCSAHAGDPDAHHSATSDGLVISPAEVRVGDATRLSNGELRLGAEANAAVTAPQLATLVGGGNADALHTHAGQGGVPARRSGQFLGLTVATYDGDMGGRFGVNAKCSLEFPDSHQCTQCEVLATERTEPLPSDAWVRPGGVCDVVGADLTFCSFFPANNGFGQSWISDRAVLPDGRRQTGPAISPNGSPFQAPCDSSLAIACCAN